jgi:hypothetical protein
MQVPEASRAGPPAAGVAPALGELLEHLDGMRSLAEAAGAVAEFGVLHLGADLAGVCVREANGQPQRLAASNHLLVQLDTIETALRQGPNTARFDDGAAITVADTRSDRLWPDWSTAAAEQDVLAVLLLEMPPLRGRSVTLQLFAHRAGAFPPDQLTVATAVARIAGLALVHIDRLGNLAEAMATRDLIGQAQGIIMERYHLSSEQAIHFLRRSSQDSQEKVRDIAQQLVSASARASEQVAPPTESGPADAEAAGDQG